MPCKTPVLRAAYSVSERGVAGRLARLKSTAFCTLSRRFSSLDRGRDRGGLRVCSGGRLERGAGRHSGAPGSGPGAKRTLRPRAGPRSRRPDAELERPDGVRGVDVHRPVRARSGQATRSGDRLADRGGPPLDELRRGPPAAPNREARRGRSSPSLSRVTSTTWAGSTGKPSVRRRDHRLAEHRDPRSQHARRPGSSSESTSSSSSSGDVGSNSASASSSERTASRCSPCEPKLRRSRVPARSDVVEMRPEPGRATRDVVRRGALEVRDRRRLAS